MLVGKEKTCLRQINFRGLYTMHLENIVQPQVDAVAKIMLVCGRDLKDLVDDDRWVYWVVELHILIDCF